VDQRSAGTREPCPEHLRDQAITDMGLLIEAHAHLVRVLGAELEAARGIPLSWFDVLIRLGRSDGQRLTMTELAGQVALSSGGATRLVDRIAEAGLVERQHCPTDRRAVYVALTAAGRAELAEAVTVHIDGVRRHLVDRLTEEERAALQGALRKLRDDGPICGG